jgi:hypothetical protein
LASRRLPILSIAGNPSFDRTLHRLISPPKTCKLLAVPSLVLSIASGLALGSGGTGAKRRIHGFGSIWDSCGTRSLRCVRLEFLMEGFEAASFLPSGGSGRGRGGLVGVSWPRRTGCLTACFDDWDAGGVWRGCMAVGGAFPMPRSMLGWTTSKARKASGSRTDRLSR